MHVKEGMYRIDGGAAGPQAFPFGEVRARDLIIEKKWFLPICWGRHSHYKIPGCDLQ